jgi:hypothetical protein
MILSIDVGTKNLALCLLDDKAGNLVREWDVDGIPPQHADGVYVSLRNHLDARPWVLTADTILIEKQPDRNKKMVSVMHFLHAYFIIRCPRAETILYDARHKIPDVAGPGRHSTIRGRRLPSKGVKSLFVLVPPMHTGSIHSSSRRRRMTWQTL